MNPFVIDVKLALRRLRQRPGFTFAAAFALALGIGSATSVYSVVQAVLLRPLPFRKPCASYHSSRPHSRYATYRALFM